MNRNAVGSVLHDSFVYAACVRVSLSMSNLTAQLCLYTRVRTYVCIRVHTISCCLYACTCEPMTARVRARIKVRVRVRMHVSA